MEEQKKVEVAEGQNGEKKSRLQTLINKKKKAQAYLERGEEKAGVFFRMMQYAMLLIFITGAAFYLRATMFDMRSGDYNSFLVKWFDRIKKNGGFLALGEKIGDYTPAYFYILAFLTYLPFDPLYSIKVVSCIFDIALAIAVTLCVWELTKDKKIAVAAYTVASLLPTVFLNSGAWAQCDSIYVSFIIFSLYFLLRKKHFTAMVFYGLGFCFKLQAIFFAPLLGVLWFKRKIPRTSPLIILGVFFLSCVPVWILGRDLGDVLRTYIAQTGQYNDRLSLNAPTLLAAFGTVRKEWVEYLSSAFVVLGITVTVFVMYICGHSKLENRSLVDFALLFALLVPYLLPHMHERYFYLADILAIVYVAIHRKRWYTLILTEFCSLWVVLNYLFTIQYLSLPLIAVLQGINLLVLCKDLWKERG